MNGENCFSPSRLFRNRHVQTITASLRFRVHRNSTMIRKSRQCIIDTGVGTRLLGFHSSHDHKNSRGLVILIHGWEGSSDSAYILHSGSFFFDREYDIFRLNLRDHGNSHHLNEGIFHGALIDETTGAVARIAEIARGGPVFLMGFSLGANFALRIALRQSIGAVAGLRRVVAVSPVLDPYRSTVMIDEGLFLYRAYFIKKWKRSLRTKEKLFPDRYDFTNILAATSILQMTDRLIRDYSDFGDCRDYFNRYTLKDGIFYDLQAPATIIMAEDDPVIPLDALYRLKGNSFLSVDVRPYGGHCGFIDPFPFGCWYELHIENLFTKDLSS
ncbi:MAG: alpha/beta fold hydrolase [Deltaproteobacteria bacterium]|nr:alpha/beta fold hydrolase [Deltaproteobacteria bacterium]